MHAIFSILSLLILSTLIMIWVTQDVSRVTETNTTGTSQDEITTPIEKATEVKNLIESNTQISLNLSGKNLTKTPEYVFDRTDLQVLNLSNNNLSGALQAEVRHLQNLRVLNLSNNNFTGVPAEIGQLKNLEELNLSNNQITGLPYELGNLSNLEILNLSGNEYSSTDLEIIKRTLPKTVTIVE